MVSPIGVFAFALWIAAGFAVWKRAPVIRERAKRLGRGSRILMSIVLLVGGALGLLVGLMSLQSGGQKAEIAANQWVSIVCLGLLFVAAQTTAGIILFSIVEDSAAQQGDTGAGSDTSKEQS